MGEWERKRKGGREKQGEREDEREDGGGHRIVTELTIWV